MLQIPGYMWLQIQEPCNTPATHYANCPTICLRQCSSKSLASNSWYGLSMGSVPLLKPERLSRSYGV